MEPGLNRDVFERWATIVDQGPYSSLAFGERMIFDNPDTIALLGACAAWTTRVRLVTTILIAPLHHPVLLAKQIATGDMLSHGRLTVGLGTGGREEDYQALDIDLAGRRHAHMADIVRRMREVWAGTPVLDGNPGTVGPPPVQPGGPPLLAGAMGPKAIRMAAEWADGVCGMSFGPDLAEIAAGFGRVRDSWREAGRTTAPHLGTSFWFAIGERDEARAQLHRHLHHYLNWMPKDEVAQIAATAGFAGPVHELKAFLEGLAALGTDEVMLISTSKDTDQLQAIADIL